MRSVNFTTRMLTYSSVCVALATLLSYVKLFPMPQGGSVSAFSMLFIVLVGYLFGVRVGFIAGIAHGLLQLVFGGYIIHPAQLILDYPLAFGALGLSGLVRNKRYGLYSGYIIGVVGRLACSVASGVIFFAEYAPAGSSVFLYSLGYNSSFMVTEAVITIAIILVPQVKTLIENIKLQS